MVEYDIPVAKLEQACQMCPGFESPTISPLQDKDWCGVKAMIHSQDAHLSMDSLSDLGAKGIILTQIKSCRM